MYCVKCGAQLADTANFCAKCGAQIQREEPQISDANPNETHNVQQTRSGMYGAAGSGKDAQEFTDSAYPYGQTQRSGAAMCRCKACKTIFPGPGVCPNCRSSDIDFKPDLYMGILALVFGILGGYLGIMFGIMGIRSAKQTGYKTLKIMCTIAIPLCIVSMLVWTIAGTAIAS